MLWCIITLVCANAILLGCKLRRGFLGTRVHYNCVLVLHLSLPIVLRLLEHSLLLLISFRRWVVHQGLLFVVRTILWDGKSSTLTLASDRVVSGICGSRENFEGPITGSVAHSTPFSVMVRGKRTLPICVLIVPRQSTLLALV